MSEVCRRMGVGSRGSSPDLVWKHINLLGISTFHFDGKAVWREALEMKRSIQRLPIERWLVVKSPANSVVLKSRLVSERILEEKCAGCKLPPIWSGKRLVLQLEHKNGIHDDCRIENLELLCPNCHSQTSTFCGRNNAKVQKIKNLNKQRHHPGLKKIEWPSPQEIGILAWIIPTTSIAKDLGVSDKAVDKYMKKFGLDKPPRGYWAMKKSSYLIKHPILAPSQSNQD